MTIDERLVVAAPKNTVARNNLALIYSQLGRVNGLIASRTIGTGEQKAARWREARGWFEKSLQIWVDSAT